MTDRPDFTESSVVVPSGSLQIESGLTWEDKDWQLPEALMRYGLGPRLELRLGLPNFVRNGEAEGFGDLYAGAKIQIGPLSDGTGLALIPAISIPVGRRGVRSETVSPEFKVVWSRGLSGGLSLSGMVFLLSTEEDGERITPVQHTISLGIPLRKQLGLFIEHVMEFERHSRPHILIHSGFTYQPHSNAQFDLHFGAGLTPTAPDLFIGIGYSVRFQP